MNRRTVGCAFVAIAAFLYSARYIAAAIYFSNMHTWSQEWFQTALNYVGSGPRYLALAALIIGLAYLAVSEWNDRKQQKQGQQVSGINIVLADQQ